MSFVHLHNHSEYSMLDGLAKVKRMAKYAAEQGMPAIALTDHGVMHGAIEFSNACLDALVQAGIQARADGWMPACTVAPAPSWDERYFACDVAHVLRQLPACLHRLRISSVRYGSG